MLSLSLSMAVTMITRSVSPLYSQLWLALRANVRGPWPLPCLANTLHHAKRMLQVFPVRASCRLERTGLVPAVRNGVVSQSRQKSFAGAPFAVAGLLVVVALVLVRINFRSVLNLSFPFLLSSLLSSLISSRLSLHAFSFSSFVFFVCLLFLVFCSSLFLSLFL